MAYARVLLSLLFLVGSVGRPPPAGRDGLQVSGVSDSLEAEIEAVLARHPEAIVAVAVEDPSTGTHLAVRGIRPYHAASTMKIPVLIEVFRQADFGIFGMEDSVFVENRFTSIVDGSIYRIEDDSDDDLYASLGKRLPIRDLAERMITVSSNLAANVLIELVTADSVQKTTERLGATSTRVLRGVEDLKAFDQGLNNMVTASDLALLLEKIRTGKAVSVAASREMREILLRQRFDEMIPAGLPGGVRVAHKTGWITAVHHDAGIVYPDGGEPYVLVILTEGFEERHTSARVGAEIARIVHRSLRGS